ncbi:MAG: HlyD family efflux transporter periplasmic adaptor subunit [Myxococcales bacterium]|nr:HlyD family efflux transporter periplasmic adaptor subunit [Myxococcales bacterium]
MKWIKRSLIALFILAVAAGVVAAFLPKPVQVELGATTRGAMQVAVEEDGRTRVQDRYTVTAPLAGNVARIELRPGDTVEEGQVIARMEPSAAPLLDARSRGELQARSLAAEASLRQAEAHAKRAEATRAYSSEQLDKTRKLVERGSVAGNELDQAELAATNAARDHESARFGVRVARYELKVAKATLARADQREKGGEKGGDTEDVEQIEIKAPVAGKVLSVLRKSEGAVAQGAALLELADPQALELVVDVLTSDAVKIAPGDEVHIVRWGGDAALRGHVRLVEPAAFTKISALGVEEQRVNAVIDLDDPPEKWTALGDGYRIEAAIVVWEAENVLQVPSSALFRRGQDWAVFVVEAGVAKLRPITIGHRNGLSVEVLEGLGDSEQVILHPGDRVVDGVAVVEARVADE